MTDATPERWLPIPGYEGYYEASDLGRIRSLPRSFRKSYVRVLRPYTRKDDHLMVALSVNGRSKSHLLHRLIALTFIGPQPSPRHEVCHNDGNPANNRPGNLRWGTRGENVLDTVRHGTNYWTSKTHCAQGHPFDERNTRIVKRSRGGTQRVCITCRRETVRQSDRRRRRKQKNSGEESAA